VDRRSDIDLERINNNFQRNYYKKILITVFGNSSIIDFGIVQ